MCTPHRNTGSSPSATGSPRCGWSTRSGVSVPGELYDVPLTTIRDQFIPAEPAELELGVIELADGESALAVVLRREVLGTPIWWTSPIGVALARLPITDRTTAGHA